MSMLKRFTSNAGANIIGGIGTAIYNLLLPSIVVHNLSASDFSIWSLGLQVMIYVQVVGFGIQTVLAKFIASDNELTSKRSLSLTCTVGREIVNRLMIIGIIISIILSFIYPLFFSGLQAEQIVVLRYCVIAFGVSASIQISALLPIGYFMGVHKNYVHISCQLFGRAFSLIAIIVFTKMNFNIQFLAVALSFCLLIYVFLLNSLLKKQNLFSANFVFDESEIYERKSNIKSQCKLLAIWSICMLCVNGLQTPIVGFYNIDEVGTYSLAYTLVLVITGLFQSALSPVITNGSSLYAKNEIKNLKKLLYVSSFGVFILGLFLLCGVFFWGHFFLKLWIGVEKAGHVFPIFFILAVAFIIRNMATPYSMMLIATGMHKNASIPAISEASCSVFLSLILGYFYGVSGVAYGVYFSSIIGLFISYLFTKDNLYFLKSIKRKFFILSFFVSSGIYSVFMVIK